MSNFTELFFFIKCSVICIWLFHVLIIVDHRITLNVIVHFFYELILTFLTVCIRVNRGGTAVIVLPSKIVINVNLSLCTRSAASTEEWRTGELDDRILSETSCVESRRVRRSDAQRTSLASEAGIARVVHAQALQNMRLQFTGRKGSGHLASDGLVEVCNLD